MLWLFSALQTFSAALTWFAWSLHRLSAGLFALTLAETRSITHKKVHPVPLASLSTHFVSVAISVNFTPQRPSWEREQGHRPQPWTHQLLLISSSASTPHITSHPSTRQCLPPTLPLSCSILLDLARSCSILLGLPRRTASNTPDESRGKGRRAKNFYVLWCFGPSMDKWVQNEPHWQGKNYPFGHWRWLVAGAMGRGLSWSHRVIRTKTWCLLIFFVTKIVHFPSGCLIEHAWWLRFGWLLFGCCSARLLFS